MDTRPLLGIDGLAQTLAISRRHAEALLATGQLPAPIRLGRCRRWHPESVDRWLAVEAGLPEPGQVIFNAQQCKSARGRPRSSN